MGSLAVTKDYIAVSKNLQIDLYNRKTHGIIDVAASLKPQENDHLVNIIISVDSKYLAAITSSSKHLLVYTLPELTSPKIYTLPRSASRIRFSIKNTHILVADKSGDVLIYDLTKEDTGTKLLGHLSLLLDILQTSDGKYIITSDRDEKIKVSCYPNTYNIKTYCLGHKEFVNHIELLPHNNKYLLSSSGDGLVKIWDYVNGKTCYTINTNNDVSDEKLIDDFTKKMDEEKIEVETLPIVHLTTMRISENTSLVAVTVHTYNNILVYNVSSFETQITHNLETKLPIEKFPTSILFYESNLYIYNETRNVITSYKYNRSTDVTFEMINTENVFENLSNGHLDEKENHFDNIKVLFKRKYDNVQEYQERKRQRLEKTANKNNG